MAKRIITISREFGSGGRFIGEEVAKKLGIKYYDKEIIGQIAKESGLAEKEPCVIIGRNADYILKDRDDVLNVYIHGDMPEKIQRICKLHNISEADAVKMINDIDKRRIKNYNFYTDQKWGKASNYTLCLNSSKLGYDKCESIIIYSNRNPQR